MRFHRRKRSERRAVDPSAAATVIGTHTHYRGDLAGEESYVVHGHVEGNCDIDGRLVLGSTARWRGDIAATHVVVAGEVDGDVYASARLELQATARIRGNITSPVIAMAEGALYDGQIRMHPRPQLVSSTKAAPGR